MYKFKLKHVKQGIIKINDRQFIENNIDDSLIIEDAPSGGDGLAFAFSRSDLFKGIFRKFTVKLRWFGDGYKFIKKYIDLEQLNTIILIDFYMYNHKTLEYDLIRQNGILNLESYKIGSQEGRGWIEIDFEDGSFEQLLMSRKDNQVDYTSITTVDNGTLTKSHEDYTTTYVYNPFKTTETYVDPADGQTKTRKIDHSSTVQCAYPLDVLDRIVENITNENGCVKSNFLGFIQRGYQSNGEGAFRMITKGRFCRGYSTSEDKLTTSFSNFFKSLGNIFGLGAGIYIESGKSFLKIEPIKYFFQDDIMFTIENPSDLTIEPNKDIIFNKVVTGYDNYEQKNDDNGQVEFNTKAEYSVPIRYFEKEFSLLSPYRADGTSINRLQTLGYDTSNLESDEMDDSIFIVSSRIDEETKLLHSCKAEPFIDIQGIYSDVLSYINLDMTPARILQNNSQFITPCCHLLTDKYIINQSYESLSKPNTLKDGESIYVKDGANRYISDLKEPFLSPFVAKFNAALTNDMILELNNNPNRKVKVYNPIDGTYISGWIREASTKPIDRETNFELLLSRTTATAKDIVYLQYMDGSNIFEMNGLQLEMMEQ